MQAMRRSGGALRALRGLVSVQQPGAISVVAQSLPLATISSPSAASVFEGSALAGNHSWGAVPRRYLWASHAALRAADVDLAAATATSSTQSLNRADQLFGVEPPGEDVTSGGNSWEDDELESEDEELPIKGSSLSIEVNMDNVDLASRRLQRALVMEGVEDVMMRNRHSVKPAVKRVKDLEDRERRIIKRKMRRKIKWFLDRRERGY